MKIERREKEVRKEWTVRVEVRENSERQKICEKRRGEVRQRENECWISLTLYQRHLPFFLNSTSISSLRLIPLIFLEFFKSQPHQYFLFHFLPPFTPHLSLFLFPAPDLYFLFISHSCFHFSPLLLPVSSLFGSSIISSTQWNSNLDELQNDGVIFIPSSTNYIIETTFKNDIYPSNI